MHVPGRAAVLCRGTKAVGCSLLLRFWGELKDLPSAIF